MEESSWLQEVVKRIISFSGQNPWTIFSDFISITAVVFAASVTDKTCVCMTYVQLIQKMLGHENIETTLIYATADMDDLRAAHAKYCT